MACTWALPFWPLDSILVSFPFVSFHDSVHKEWPVKRLSGWDMRGVLGKWLGEKNGEVRVCVIFSLLPFYLHCLLREFHYHSSIIINIISANDLDWSNPSTLSLHPSQSKAYQPWLCDIIKGLFSLKSPHLPVNCIANIAFG